MMNGNERAAWQLYASAALRGLLAQSGLSATCDAIAAECRKYADALVREEHARFDSDWLSENT